MDKKEQYLKRNNTARRGGMKERTGTAHARVRRARREHIPKWSKWGSEAPLNWNSFETGPRRAAHEKEKELSTLNKNYRRNENPVTKRRKYWKPQRDPI